MSDVFDPRDILSILWEEEDDDDLLLLHYSRKRRKHTIPLFKTRKTEGSYSVLIRNHLLGDEKIFREYCRLNKKQFDFVLSFIYMDIRPKVLRAAVSAEEKLFLTLR